MPWLVYIIRCFDDTLYTGITNDLVARLEKHNQGKASKYTRVRLPVRLVYRQECGSKSLALRLEAKIKKLSRKEKLVLMI